MEYLLQMQHICKEFPGVKALSDVNIDIQPGEVHALVGENMLDIRTEGEYRRRHLNGFRNIPLDDLREHLDELDRGKPVYVNCQTGQIGRAHV